MLPIDKSILLNIALRCRDGGWLDDPPQYRSDGDILASYKRDHLSDDAEMRYQAYGQRQGLKPAVRIYYD